MFSNIISVLLVKGFNVLARMIALFMLAKVSSPEEFGVISLMVAAAEILRIVADFGMDTLSVRDFAISPSEKSKSKIASNIAVVKVFLGLVVYGFMVIAILLSKYHSYIVLGLLAGILLLTSLWSNLPINYFQSQLKMRTLILPTFFISACTLLLLFIAISLKENTVVIFATIPFSELIGTIILYTYLRKELSMSILSINRKRIMGLLKKSFPIALTMISVVIYTRLDIFALGNFSSKEEIGFYGVAYRITEPFQFIAAAYAITIYSNISSRLILKQGSIIPAVKKYLVLSGLYSSIVSIFLILISPIIVRTFLPKYLPCIPILYILSIALVFRVLNNCITSVINAHGQYSKMTLVCAWNLFLVSALILLSLNQINSVRVASILAFAEFINTLIQLCLMKYIFDKKKYSGSS